MAASSSTRNTLLAAALAICLTAGGAYYLVKQDQRVKRRKRARAAEKAAMQLLQQVSNDRRELLESHHNNNKDTVPERREYAVAYCNEMLLRLLERLDAIQPRAAIMEDCSDGDTPTPFEESLIDNVKRRKRKLIVRINQDFEQIDQGARKHNREATQQSL